MSIYRQLPPDSSLLHFMGKKQRRRFDVHPNSIAAVGIVARGLGRVDLDPNARNGAYLTLNEDGERAIGEMFASYRKAG